MPRLFPSFLTLSCILASPAFASIGPVADLTITNKDVSPDGFTRGAVVAGDSTIGPLIVGNKGDEFQINVVNNLDDDTMLQSTSIHWHGFYQKDTPWADGTAFVTQCPIAKGDSFLYDFKAQDQAGTFWYHSHLSTQYCDGLRGPLVVYDTEDPHASLYDVDDESTVITLADWYHTKAKQIAFGTPQSTLINGLGRWSDANATSSLAVITVESGKRYRFRVVNAACDPAYEFYISNHTFTVIEADSINHEPVTADSVTMYAGQRYSLVMEANQPVGNYWIRANPNAGSTGFVNGINSAILRYVGASEEEPEVTTEFEPTAPLSESDLIPLENPGAPGDATIGGVDVAMHLNFGFSFTPPTVPVLLQIMSGAQSADNLLPEGMVFPLPANSTVELSFTGGLLGIEHPMHLHGHAFDVVRVAGSSTYNYANPVRRDVVNIGGASDNVTIRFSTDNPGPWIMHCHIDWHLEAGFAVVFAERTDEWTTLTAPPTAWDNLCPTYDALDSGDL
ncbi:laccase, multicopper oxidase, benzenediol:oxygen oxidorectuctase [Marasmius tenuissimus]|uniref:Laccase, multicopper oxidase, benzenediol:oxygen oxidorectuctase n=1 Tax=Marasmius tenuissimus TaxID=585030 RepID=A0ABR2ZEJ4_9AGAR